MAKQPNNTNAFHVEFLTLNLPPDDDVPSTGIVSLTLSTQRFEPGIPMWKNGELTEVINGLMSLKISAPEANRVGAIAALSIIADREKQLHRQLREWLKARAKKEETSGRREPVYVVSWKTPRPMGDAARTSRPSYVSLRHFAESMVGREGGIHPSRDDSRMLCVLRNRVTVEEGGNESEQEVPDIMVTGILGGSDTDPDDDFVVFFLPTDDGFAAPMTLEDLVLRPRTVRSKKAPAFAEVGALNILDEQAPELADRIREARVAQAAAQAKLEAARVEAIAKAEAAAARPTRRGRAGGGATVGERVAAKGGKLPEVEAATPAPAQAEVAVEASAAPAPAAVAQPAQPDAAEAETAPTPSPKAKAKDRRQAERKGSGAPKPKAPAKARASAGDAE